MKKKAYPFPAELWDSFWRSHSDAARNGLAEYYLGIVISCAHALAARLPKSVDVGDLIQAGSIGLLKAIKNFDPAKSIFSHHAKFRINGEMIDHLRAMTVGRTQLKLLAKIEAAERHLTAEHGRNPTDDELSDALEKPISCGQMYRTRNHRFQSINAPIQSFIPSSEREQHTFADIIPDGRQCDPANHVEQKEMIESIENYVISHCQFKVAILFKARYRLGMTCQEMHDSLGMSDGNIFYFTRLLQRSIQHAVECGILNQAA